MAAIHARAKIDSCANSHTPVGRVLEGRVEVADPCFPECVQRDSCPRFPPREGVFSVVTPFPSIALACQQVGTSAMSISLVYTPPSPDRALPTASDRLFAAPVKNVGGEEAL